MQRWAAAIAALAVVCIVGLTFNPSSPAVLLEDVSSQAQPSRSSLLREVSASPASVDGFLSSLLSSLERSPAHPSLIVVEDKMNTVRGLASLSPASLSLVAASLSSLPVPPQALLDYDTTFIPPYVDDLDTYLDNVITQVENTDIPNLDEEARSVPASLRVKRRATILSSNFLADQGVYTGEAASDDHHVRLGDKNPSVFLPAERHPVHLVPDNAPLAPPPSHRNRLDRLGVNTGSTHATWDDERITTDGMEEPYQAGASSVRETKSPSANAGGINFF